MMHSIRLRECWRTFVPSPFGVHEIQAMNIMVLRDGGRMDQRAHSSKGPCACERIDPRAKRSLRLRAGRPIGLETPASACLRVRRLNGRSASGIAPRSIVVFTIVSDQQDKRLVGQRAHASIGRLASGSQGVLANDLMGAEAQRTCMQ